MGLARAELQHEYAALQRSRAALGAETNEFAQYASIEAEQRANDILQEREAHAASALEGRLVDAGFKAEHHVQVKIREFEEKAQRELQPRTNNEFHSKLRFAEDRAFSTSAEHHAAAEKAMHDSRAAQAAAEAREQALKSEISRNQHVSQKQNKRSMDRVDTVLNEAVSRTNAQVESAVNNALGQMSKGHEAVLQQMAQSAAAAEERNHVMFNRFEQMVTHMAALTSTIVRTKTSVASGSGDPNPSGGG